MRCSPLTVSLVAAIQLLLLPSISYAQTVTECVRRVPETARGTVCDIRQYRATGGAEADRYLSCALQAIGFVAEDGSVKRNVVLAALDEVETHDGVFTDSVDACLSKARKLTNGVERPNAFFTCMLATESAHNFKDALELQELKVASQWNDEEAFDRARVQHLMRELNGRMQCK